MLKTLLAQVKQYKTVSLLTPLFAIMEVLVDTLIPLAIDALIDKGIDVRNIRAVYLYGGIMILLAILGLIFGILAGRYAALASSGFACNVRDATFSNIQTFSFSNIDKFSTASLVTRLTTDVTNLQNAYQMIIRMCIRAPFMLICSLIMACLISPSLSMVFVIAIVILIVLLGLIIFNAMGRFNKVFLRYDDLNNSIQENVSSIRVVKAFVREDHENIKFKKATDNLYRMFVSAEKIVACNQPVMMLAVYSCMISLSWLGAKTIVSGTLTTGALTALFSYVASIMMSLMMLSMVFVMITMSVASARRIVEVIQEKSSLASPDHAEKNMTEGSIDFNHVSFSYQQENSNPVLQDINLHIHAGETIGIIGGTGSAKSSLINLISRLYDVTEGSVLVGGKDVRSYDLETLRDEVSVVLQKNVLFSGTILDNLRWGNEHATEEECIQACKLACADDFICQFPDRYQTYIEQGGSNVSGGQKQRLCIARALLKNPKILILDDSTSAVDTATDTRIREAFRSAIPDTTKLIIAQRMQTAFSFWMTGMSTVLIHIQIYWKQTKSTGKFMKARHRAAVILIRREVLHNGSAKNSSWSRRKRLCRSASQNRKSRPDHQTSFLYFVSQLCSAAFSRTALHSWNSHRFCTWYSFYTDSDRPVYYAIISFQASGFCSACGCSGSDCSDLCLWCSMFFRF
jgi:ATP-binding cassette subfamily B protein